MSAWDKLQLGWLNYDKAKAATKSTHKLGVAEYNTKHKQALVVELPAKAVTTTVVKPAEGEKQWWSGMGDDLKNTLTRPVDLTGKSAASLDAQGLVGHRGELRLPLRRGLHRRRRQLDAARRHRGRQGHPARRRRQARADRHVRVRTRTSSSRWTRTRARRSTSASATPPTAAWPRRASRPTPSPSRPTARPLFADDAEGDDNGWTPKGFSRIGESFTKDYPQYYIAENRQYVVVRQDPQGRPVQLRLDLDTGPTGSSTTRTRTAC